MNTDRKLKFLYVWVTVLMLVLAFAVLQNRIALDRIARDERTACLRSIDGRATFRNFVTFALAPTPGAAPRTVQQEQQIDAFRDLLLAKIPPIPLASCKGSSQ